MNQIRRSHPRLLALAVAGVLFSSTALAGPEGFSGAQQDGQRHYDGNRIGHSRDSRQPSSNWQGDSRETQRHDATPQQSSRDTRSNHDAPRQTAQHDVRQPQQKPVARPLPVHRGTVVPRLPSGYRMMHHRDHDYYYVRGVWYRPHGTSFIVVLPPIGLTIPVLPVGYVTLIVGGQPYYRYDDVYYMQRGSHYVVVDAPSSNQISASGSDELFIYPARNQSENRQAQDRYECHQWGSNQTGYDPTQPYGGVAAGQSASSRADYQRAMTACLEARGYTVR